MTKEDRIVFRKIIVLSSLSALLGIVILILYIGFAASAASNDPNIVLSAVYISFSLEIFSCVMIYIVFTTQIKVSAKERLQFVTRIAIEKSNKEAVISYPKSLSHIGDKLYYYF